jgi:acyl-CoA synthetase (AMP-forming)/AMP-acid ligase II
MHGRVGVQPGDRVAVTLPNIPQMPIIYYGILWAGGVVVPINPLYKSREFAFVLAAAALVASVIDAEIYKLVVAVTVLSLVISPIYVDAIQRTQARAAARAPSLGKLLRLIYFREWRLTRRASLTVWGAVHRVGSLLNAWAQRLMAMARAKGAVQPGEGTTVAKSTPMPGQPPAQPPPEAR